MVILSSLETALAQGSEDPTALQEAEASTLQAAEMIEQLMVFSRSEQAPDFQPVQLQTLLHNTAAVCQKVFDRSITVSLDLPTRLPTVFGDANQLEQVFLNLLINARDAVEERPSSSPTIRLEATTTYYREEALVAQPDAKSGSYVRVQCADNGIGMDAATKQRIFDPFFTTKEEGKGTGLGLSTVFGIVREHQGWIACESQQGAGTTFALYLPVSDQEQAVSQAEATGQILGGSETILLIEDEEIMQRRLRAILERSGYTVLVSGNGNEGWQMYQDQRAQIHLVVLDMSMPGLSGREVLARIHGLDSEVKVVISTGYAEYRAETLGAKALLKKPYRLIQALETIRQVLDE